MSRDVRNLLRAVAVNSAANRPSSSYMTDLRSA